MYNLGGLYQCHITLYEVGRVIKKIFAIYNLWTTPNQDCRYTDQSVIGYI